MHNCREPIFTLPVPGSRIYIVTEPSLASLVQRNTKTLSFTPLIPDVTKRVLGLDKESFDIVSQNLDPEPGAPRGFLADTHDTVYTILGPGQDLTDLVRKAVGDFQQRLSTVQTNYLNGTSPDGPIDLLDWLRELVTLGTTSYFFGPHDPFKDDPSLISAFWDFDFGIGGLLVGVVPEITASKAYRGREKIVAALTKYFEAGYQEYGSKLARDRAKVDRQYGLSMEMTARSALSFFFAAIINTTTITFWMSLRFFAEPSLLEKARAEMANAIAESEKLHGAQTWSIDIFKNNCTTMSDVFQETLRLGSENFSTRLVKEDTMLADKYFLKKGSVVQVSGGIIHADKSIWGDDADAFNPHRFAGGKRAANVHPAAFRGFGGGKTLCPGRHFATTEILMLVSLIINTLEMTGVDGGVPLVPPKNDRVLPVHVLEPLKKDKPKVIIKARKRADDLSKIKIVN